MNEKPKPIATAETLPYWQGAHAGELRYTWCAACERAMFPPRSVCTTCRAPSQWRTSQGRGVIHALTRVERAPLAAFRDEVPYFIALIDLGEGFRIMANLRGDTVFAAKIGDQIDIIFEPVGDGISLPQGLVGRGV